jgi:hypothetical protein
MLCAASLILSVALADAPAASSAEERAPARPRRSSMHDYLVREAPRSARFLDHGVLAAGVAVGAPHGYRLAVTVGLLDHLTIGATANWLPGQARPGWSPLLALAFFRARWLSVGATYFQLLYPTPVIDLDPTTLSFQRRAHYVMGTVSFSQGWLSGGFDVGLARGPEADPFAVTMDPINQTPIVRTRLGAGLHLRAGTRRVGVIGQVIYPFISAELALELRFGVFERRARAQRWEL